MRRPVGAGHTEAVRRPSIPVLSAGQRWLLTVFVALVAGAGAIWLGFELRTAMNLADRFAHHSVTVDATITGTVRLGCFGASGIGRGLGSGDTVYAITFPHPGGVHETTVTRPCDVIPPDFGRGRGAIWIQYDVADLDRTRVLTDTTAERTVRVLPVPILALVWLAGWCGWRARIVPEVPTRR